MTGVGQRRVPTSRVGGKRRARAKRRRPHAGQFLASESPGCARCLAGHWWLISVFVTVRASPVPSAVWRAGSCLLGRHKCGTNFDRARQKGGLRALPARRPRRRRGTAVPLTNLRHTPTRANSKIRIAPCKPSAGAKTSRAWQPCFHDREIKYVSQERGRKCPQSTRPC